MASHRRGLGCFSPLAGWLGVAALAWATRSLTFTLSGTFRPVQCPRHGGVARHAEDPFAQRGGISAADLRDRRPEEESFVQYREPRQRSGQRPGFKESSALRLGGPRRTFKARAEEEEEPANLTKEEREQRFREQIKSPVTLTTFIKRTGSPEEFMWVMWTAMDETMLNHIHLVAAFTKLAALKKKAAPFSDRIRKSPTLVEMAKQAARVADRREFRPRETASMLMAAASLRTELPWIGEILGVPLAKWVPEHAATMTPQSFAHTVYGLGVLNLGDEKEVVEAIRACAQAIPLQLGRFSGMDIAQVAWGLGARESREEAGELLDAIEKWVIREAKPMSVRSAVVDLPMIAVAFARLGDWRPKMMDAIARRLYHRPTMQELRLWSLAALVWVWTHPSSPWQGQSEMHAEFPELAPGKGGFEEAELARLFLGRLKKQANRRKVTEEDIERAPMGPKGETSQVWSGNFWKSSKPPMERLVA